MNDSVILILLSIGFVLLVSIIAVVAWLHNRKRERERTFAFRSTATMLGWQFAEEAGMDYLPNLQGFPLFSEGHSKKIKNLLYGDTSGVKAALFDYVYTVGHGKNAHTYRQSVAYFEPRDLNLPSFSLRPENFMHKVMTAFGYQDIDFGNRPTFSSQYLLRGADEQPIRNTFSDHVLSFYENHPGTCSDGGGNQLFVFRQGYRTPPHEAQLFLDKAYQLQRLFPRRF